MGRNFEFKIQELQQKLTALINQKTETLANTQNKIAEYYNMRQRNLDQQIATLQRAMTDMHHQQQDRSTVVDLKLKQINDKLAHSQYRLAEVQEFITALTLKTNFTSNELQICQGSSNQSLRKLKQQLQAKLNFAMENSHSAFFSLKRQLNSIAITYNGSDLNYRSFIKNIVVEVEVVSTYSLKQTKTKNKNIMFGLATNAILGQTSACLNKECLVYYSCSGRIYQNGKGKAGGRAVNDGQVISLQIDTMQWLVKWSVGQQQLWQASIPQQMLNKVLYIVVLMVNQDDMVELLNS